MTTFIAEKIERTLKEITADELCDGKFTRIHVTPIDEDGTKRGSGFDYVYNRKRGDALLADPKNIIESIEGGRLPEAGYGPNESLSMLTDRGYELLFADKPKTPGILRDEHITRQIPQSPDPERMVYHYRFYGSSGERGLTLKPNGERLPVIVNIEFYGRIFKLEQMRDYLNRHPWVMRVWQRGSVENGHLKATVRIPADKLAEWDKLIPANPDLVGEVSFSGKKRPRVRKYLDKNTVAHALVWNQTPIGDPLQITKFKRPR